MKQIKDLIAIIDYTSVDGDVDFEELMKFIRKKGLIHDIPKELALKMYYDAGINRREETKD